MKLERRRLEAARLLTRGLSEADVARCVGVHRQSVNRWARQLALGGRCALKRAPRTGRPPQLSPADRKRIERVLLRGAEALGYGTGLWTAWRVADLIARECGVQYSTVHAWRVARALGWTPQRPGRPRAGTPRRHRCAVDARAVARANKKRRVIWDGLPGHRGAGVRDFVAAQGDRLD